MLSSNTILERQTDFVKLAEAFGAKAERVDTLDGFFSLMSSSSKLTEFSLSSSRMEHTSGNLYSWSTSCCEGPYLIDCLIGEDEFVLPMLPPGGSMDDMITKVGD